MNRKTLIAVALAGVLVGCKPGTPKQYIQPDEMEEILYDYHIAQAMAQLEDGSMEQRNFDRSFNVAAVLKKHGVTQAEFDSSLVYYYTRADKFQHMYQRVAERLSDKALSLGASEGEVERFVTLSMNGDTANVWEGNRSAVLLPYAPANRIDFRQAVDTTYRKGDVLMLNMMVDFMYQTGSKDGVVCLAVKLDNDSVISRVNHISVSGINQLRITTDDNHAIKEIYGFFYLAKCSDQSSTLKLMFLNDIQLIRFHQRKPETPALPKDSLNQRKDSLSRGKDSIAINDLKTKDI